MQMIKYENKWINRLFIKLKSLFMKKSERKELEEIKNVVVQPKKEIDYEAITGCKKYNPKEITIQIMNKFEKNQSIIKDLTDEQIKEMIEYYQEKNKELNREYEYKRKKFNNLAKKLNDYYEKTKKKLEMDMKY